MSKNRQVNLDNYPILTDQEVITEASELLKIPELNTYYEKGLITLNTIKHVVLLNDLRGLMKSLNRITDAYDVVAKKYNYETRNVQVIWKNKKPLLDLIK